MIVDFTVVSNLQRAIFVGHRLMARGYINDAEPTMAECDTNVNINAFVVRTTMSHDVAHTLDYLRVNCPVGFTAYRYTVYSAHNDR
jgi:hypothetical protein